MTPAILAGVETKRKKDTTMNDKPFQQPWQHTFLRIHAAIEKVVAPIERFFSGLNPNNHTFQQELNRPQLRTVK
jgi:hypothetical protein